ncbi:hypothetical protein BJ165DRAFT_1524868 [Panaeolus papilionaceus]|nr:hypothetical protein BJ165DRAFT_1524868 [Panaeolus papilionaceus]
MPFTPIDLTSIASALLVASSWANAQSELEIERGMTVPRCSGKCGRSTSASGYESDNLTPCTCERENMMDFASPSTSMSTTQRR